MRHLNIVHRKGYQAFETVTEEEQLLFESLQDTYEGQKGPPPPPGMTLIQTGNGDAFGTCEYSADHILRRHRFYFFSFASHSGDERYWAIEHILAIWPLLRGGKALKDILSENPGISEQELDSIAMQRLSKMALWQETRKNISSEVIDSISTAYLGGKDYSTKGTVASLI
jgi:hypothetical protein